MPKPQPCSLHALLPALALLLLLPACAPRLRTSAWVVRFDMDSPAEVASVCSEAKRAGFDQLLVQVRGRADALYQSDIAPKAGNLAAAPADQRAGAAISLLAFARPFLPGGAAASAPSAGAREVVILLDRSYSMGYGDRWSLA